jgi:hypothetical protein
MPTWSHLPPGRAGPVGSMIANVGAIDPTPQQVDDDHGSAIRRWSAVP